MLDRRAVCTPAITTRLGVRETLSLAANSYLRELARQVGLEPIIMNLKWWMTIMSLQVVFESVLRLRKAHGKRKVKCEAGHTKFDFKLCKLLQSPALQAASLHSQKAKSAGDKDLYGLTVSSVPEFCCWFPFVVFRAFRNLL